MKAKNDFVQILKSLPREEVNVAHLVDVGSWIGNQRDEEDYSLWLGRALLEIKRLRDETQPIYHARRHV